MKKLSMIVSLILLMPSEAGASCEPIPDSPTARLMYYSGSSIVVGPRSPLDDGTVARLKCNFDTRANGQTTATCVNGKWNGLPLGTCVK